MNDLVSIVMPSYNAEQYIEKTLNSILSQIYTNWELIIVDDCSSDSTVSIIEKFMKECGKIYLIKLNENKGQAHARNEGINRSRGRFLTFIDSDDLWNESFLETSIGFIKKKDCEIVFTAFERKNEDLTKSFGILGVPEKIVYKDLLKNNYFSCLTTVINIEKTGKVYFEENFKHEDHIYWLKIMKDYAKCAYGLNKNLATYRIRNNSASRNKIKSAKWKWRIYREYLKLNLFSSMYYFSYYTVNGVLKNYKFIIGN